MCRVLLLLALLLSAAPACLSFAVPGARPTHRAASSKLHGFFDKAFANEDLGKRENAGLKNGPKYNEAVTINGESCCKEER